MPAGIPDSDIFIVFALGIHRLQTDDERRTIVGDEIFRRIRMFDHVSTDDASLVTTVWDHVVRQPRRD